MSGAAEIVSRLEASVKAVMLGQENTVRRVIATMIAGGHVLLEDVPGTGKTTLAKAIAASIGGGDFQRIQFTPDLLPSDILGVSVLDARNASFEFHRGPIFSDILLADEVNRASPRTQSALLEAMAEKQVTVEGNRYDLGDLFFVIATQNPVELRGTYPLPEAQMDRFAYQCSLGYVSVDQEMAILNAQEQAHPLTRVEQVVTRGDLLRVRKAVAAVSITPGLQEYLVRLVAGTRGRPGVKLAASPRASLNLLRISQALSLLEGRDFVLPETIQSLAPGVIGHRLVLEADAQYAGRTGQSVVSEIVEELAVPV
ncbi:MoxR family ATPase [Akkermansiaceae bacterium]|jgi:MoxR-like ATPase|nr:MoxR family ATPase [Akkermansiaceae bacterium]MDB4484537.1 MoxR family ATPase [bacterium]MDA7908067.1 MoxR family ATPase [Akkermansiaceae bacterium]MDA7933767.1 MoxR family ATPase [Akkermansiaceae bacterium]MDB4369869.1 MoxR family ATPase [Akkermansiaceae bacterium]